jgi:hypothetical protein
MKKTKWVDHKFTKDEKRAQGIWRRAEKQRSEIVQALKSCDHYMSREDMHKRLDRRLDAIEKMKHRARDIFPEISESFTMYRGTI